VSEVEGIETPGRRVKPRPGRCRDCSSSCGSCSRSSCPMT
jgi:hypothetical protein